MPGTTILSALVNGNNTDFAGGLSNAMCKDGQQVAAANIPMGNFKFTGLGAGSARTDSISLGQSQDGLVNWVVSGGSSDAITATYSPAVTFLFDGQLCYFRATAANATTTPTFSPNGITAHTITKVGGTALVAGDIPGNLAECELRYNLSGARWELVNPAVPTASIGAGQFSASASGFNEPLNLQLVASINTPSANLLTVAVKNTAGNDPSSADPVIVPFRDSTATGGGNIIVKITSALSINTFATGASLGAYLYAFRFWVVCFNNGGSPVLALINCLNPTTNALQVYPLNDRLVQSSTPISGSATSAGVFYTPNGVTVSNKSICVLGYIEWNSTGLATPGTYNVAPQFVQLAGPHTPRPGYTVQGMYCTTTTSTQSNGATKVNLSGFGPSPTISLTSAANPVRVRLVGNAANTSASSTGTVNLFRTNNTITIGTTSGSINGSASSQSSNVICEAVDLPNNTSTTYGAYVLGTTTAMTWLSSTGQGVGGLGILTLEEIMA